ncbi:MAG: hypothetical protein QCI38_00060 [Candidatus Thermoplasmatota archaeon]|nr:hypothetical protein [Candidatus Thermoplasmatota archaeon]
MYSFSTSQKRYNMGNIHFGGQPGELPTLLLGSVFYGKRYASPSKDILDGVERDISAQRALSETTGNPGILDVFIDDEKNIEPRLSFVLERLHPEEPFAIDIPEPEVRMEALRYLGKRDELWRVIYNSLNLGITDGEREILQSYTPRAAILLGYNPRDLSTDGRMGILDHGASMVEDGLIATAKDLGIEILLLDTAATPFNHMAAETLRAIPAMKNKWGYPVGCSIHNTVESWKWLKGRKKEDPDLYRLCDVGSNGLAVLLGADYMVYGPASSAPYVFPYVAMVDKLVSEGAEEYFGVEPMNKEAHPRSRLP